MLLNTKTKIKEREFTLITMRAFMRPSFKKVVFCSASQQLVSCRQGRRPAGRQAVEDRFEPPGSKGAVFGLKNPVGKPRLTPLI